jgi:hypothetical protein
VTAPGEALSLDKVRLFMETADGGFGLSALRELAVSRPQVAEYSPEELDLLTQKNSGPSLRLPGLSEWVTSSTRGVGGTSTL